MTPPYVQPLRGSITWRLAGERLALLAWGRAILLQFAHPAVAAGVAAHSGFRAGPVAPLVRLQRTVGAMRRIVFGTPAQAEAAIRGIRHIHDRVHGVDPAGRPYSAHRPDLLLWVHATLLDSHVRVLGPVLGPFSTTELDAYCREVAPLALALGARPEDVPVEWAALERYLQAQVAAGVIGVGDTARELAPYVLKPGARWLAWPIARAVERISVGTLPAGIRAGYGTRWTAADDDALARSFERLRAVRARTPEVIARWPEAR